MLRSRILKLVVLLIALGAVTYLLVSLYLPSSRRLIFGVDKNSGKVRIAQAGVTYLPPHQFYRLSFERRGDAAQRDGVVVITSKDGVPVKMTYRLRFDVQGNPIPDPRRLVEQGWSAWIAARVTEAVDAVTAQVPIEDLISPLSEFSSRRDRLRTTVSHHLAQSGLKVRGFEIERLEVDRPALLRAKRAELRRNARGNAGRVALFAIDGADWELLAEMAQDGELPNIKALMQRGATANVGTIQPTIAPLLWTTVATGLPPDRHHVLDFIDREHGNRPIDAASRRVPAAWDIANAFGRTSEVVGYWTDWPPTNSGTFVFDTPVELSPGAVSPRNFSARASSLVVPEMSIDYPQIRRFANITPAEYESAIRAQQPGDPILILRSLLAKMWSDHRVGIDWYQRYQPNLLMFEFSGTDSVNHLYGPYHPPYRDGVSSEGYRKFWPTVVAYYSEVDRLLGEWMAVLPPDTTVIVMSAHGMKWGSQRPDAPPNGRSALSDHRNPGILIAYGNHVSPSPARRPIGLYDIAPTLFALLGLPQSSEMQGQFPSGMIRDVVPVTGVHIVSYSDFVDSAPDPTEHLDVDAKTYAARLQAVGHSVDPNRESIPMFEEGKPERPSTVSPQQWGEYAYFNNLGVEKRKEGKLDEAAQALDRAIQLNPTRPTPYMNLAIVLIARQQYSTAEDLIFNAIERGLPSPDKVLVDVASDYRAHNMTTRAIGLLTRAKQVFPQSYLIAANLGSALSAAERYSDGETELVRALGLRPSSTLVLNNLGTIYFARRDFARALDYWNRSLSIDPRQPQIRDAVAALRTRL